MIVQVNSHVSMRDVLIHAENQIHADEEPSVTVKIDKLYVAVHQDIQEIQILRVFLVSLIKTLNRF